MWKYNIVKFIILLFTATWTAACYKSTKLKKKTQLNGIITLHYINAAINNICKI